MHKESIHILGSLIENFKDLPLVNVKTEQTFMQLTSYPHLENVWSNILGFYFHTQEAHGFGGLFIKSLLECVGVNSNFRSSEAVEREVITDKGNRIDILIETDNHLIAIENKVYSRLNNPLGDYENYINTLNSECEKTPLFILLTLHKEDVGNSAFINVTYSNFFAAIRKNLGAYVVNANTKWIILLNDFITTVDELQGGTILDKEFIHFYNENQASIDTLLNARKDLPKFIKSKLQSVMSLVSVDNRLKEGKYDVSYDVCCVEYDLTYNMIKRVGASVHWLIYINTEGLYILMGVAKATSGQMKSLEQFLTGTDLQCSRWEGSSDYLCLKKLDIFESDDMLAKQLQSLLDTVNNALN